MAKEITTQDIFELLQDFMQITSDRFDALDEKIDHLESRMDRLESRMDSLENRMDRLESRLSALETASREHTQAIKDLTSRVENIEMTLLGVNDDIVYLYKLVEKLKKDLKKGRLSEEETRSRLEEVEAIARQLSQKYGLKHS